MNYFENISQTFKHGSSVIKLIYINIAVFVLVKLSIVLLLLFNISDTFLISNLAIPADLNNLLLHAWTIFTYMFLHEGIMHILFNMLTLYWFGKIFLLFFSDKQLVGLYLFGGLIAGLFYIIAFNIFPYYSLILHQSLLLGASGSIMAIIVATAFQSPNMEMQLLIIGPVKLKYIAIVTVLMSLFGITSSNGGGELAHLGGALAGCIFIVSLHQGKDLTKIFSRTLDYIDSIFKPRKLKVKYNKTGNKTRMSDAEFNATKAHKMAEIDKILDKIKTSGYESLSAEEKKRLFEQGNK